MTVVLSEKGWVRALKGHQADLSALAFKGDDALKTSFFAETTSKVLLLATNGKVFTLEASKLPGGRGFGEPVRLIADIEDGVDVTALIPYRPGVKMLVAASDGRGFIAPQDEMIGNTRKGKAILNVDNGAKARVIVEADGDHVATIGENRKLLVFPLDDVPEMTRGKGVRLQRYKDGGIADAKVFKMSEGLTWKDSAGRTFTVNRPELQAWDRQPRRGGPSAA